MTRDEEWLLKEKYQGEKTEGFFADCLRLESGEPLAYLIGHIPFLKATIFLDSKPLIPRPETEYWVAKFLSEHSDNHPDSPHILDLCAGSGCIGVAVGLSFPTSHIDCCEIDLTHHVTIADNWKTNGLEPDRLRLYGGSLYESLPTTEKYHYILSNPPYIDKSLKRTEASVVAYEPALALYGGEAGLELIADIIKGAPAHLQPHGELWIEHEAEQVAAIATLGQEAGFIVHTHEDQYGVARYSQLVLQ